MSNFHESMMKARNLLHRNKKIVVPHEESDSDSVSEDEAPIIVKEKSRRPKENNFTQQRLKALHPIITPKYVIPLFLIIAVLFIPLGAGMLYGSNKVQDITLDYTQCENLATGDTYVDMPAEYYEYHFNSKNETIIPKWKYSKNITEEGEDDKESGICRLQFEIPNKMGPAVFLFYKVENFYANHRRYAKSYSEYQLNGDASSLSVIKDTVGQNCQPLSENSEGKKYYPCGLIANAMFNDTFVGLNAVNSTSTNYTMTNKGIAWSTNKNRFKKTKYKASEVVPPPNWVKKFPNGYNDDNLPDISTWHEFQNWMQTPALPTFSKLALRNDDDAIEPGTYEVVVGLHWPVTEFDGKKKVYISTRSVIGGRNPFLGIVWIVAGGICLLLSIAFTIINLLVHRKVGDISLLSWNSE